MEYDFGVTSSRDAVAEKFVSSFLALQRGIAHTVEKGLSKSFETYSCLSQAQREIDEILERLANEPMNPEDKAKLVCRLNMLLDGMCEAQIRTNYTWNQVDEQASQSLTETEDYWKRAESFFRGKPKRGDNRVVQPVDPRGKNRKAPATNGISKPPPMKPTGNEVVRPSLMPKRPNGTSIIRKTKSSALLDAPRRLETEQSRESHRSDSPEKVRQERRSKPTPSAARKTEKRVDVQIKSRDVKEKDKEKKSSKTSAALAAKKRRIARATSRVTKKQVKDDSDESASEDSKESSDPSYQAPSDTAKTSRQNSSYDNDRGASRKNDNGKNDPDEPRYCTCRNVSFGHMVGCDNDSCAIEWFHFVCVGLKAKPRGKWFCPDCRDGDNSKISKNLVQNEGTVGAEK